MLRSSPKALKIAILGTRGIPACYGGFETFAEELSVRLVERGHTVRVYRRRRFFASARPNDELYRGVFVRDVPTVMHKYLETIVHSLLSFLDLLRDPVDVVLLCNAANSPWAFLARIRGIPVAINVDGIERRRKKWNFFGRLWYRLGELCSVLFASRVIADAKVIADYYRERFRCGSTVIAYGASARSLPAGKALQSLQVSPREYLLYVSRLEPENNALGVIQAYNGVATTMPLVIVGDAPYATEYITLLKEEACDRVIFAGYQFGDAYHELQSNCFAYIQATEVGGTHPALIEAMAHGNCVLANGTPENREVVGDAAFVYPKNDFDALRDLISHLLTHPDEVHSYRASAKQRADECYQWDAVTTQYETLFFELTARSALAASPEAV